MNLFRDMFGFIKNKNTVIVILILALLFNIKKCSDNRAELKSTITAWKQLQKQKEDSLIQVINKKGEEITTQKQLLITEKQAKDMLLLENENLKKIKSKVKVVTKTEVKEVFIPYDTTIIIHDSLYDSTFIAKGFSVNDKWYSVKGITLKKGIYIDKIAFNNEIETVIGYEKPKGIKKLWESSKPVVQVNNKNPYSSTVQMENIVIQPPKKKFYQTKGFYFLAGAVGSLMIFK
jgi:hypothetical protein